VPKARAEAVLTGCARASVALILSFGSTTRRRRIKSRAVSLTCFQKRSWKMTLPRVVSRMSCSLSSERKGE
jgi:hypothetical protein